MWYVIQVMTGKEEEMKAAIEKIISNDCYERCFYLKRERIWRRNGQCILHEEPLFPGYLFVSTDRPEAVFLALKEVPRLTKLLKSGGVDNQDTFVPVAEEEQKFLNNLVMGDSKYVVRLSEVEVDEDNNIISVEGPLKKYIDKVVRKKIRLRYVFIKIRLLGKEREILVGIRLRNEEIEKA